MTNEATDQSTGSPAPGRRARRTRDEVEVVLAGFRASGQTVAAYARASGVPEASLRAWLAWRARRERQEAQATGAFAPVRLVRGPLAPPPGGGAESGAAAAGGAAVVLRWPSGLEARLEVGVDPAWAAAVLRALEGWCWR